MYDRSKLPREPLALLCRRYHVRELSLFGSALQPEYSENSDLDLLVTFEPDAKVGFLTLAGLGRELSDLLGRPVDLVPKNGLKPRIRDEVLTHTEVLFAA